MSTSTPNLSLPYIQAAQAQKHVTHNDAIRALDAIVQLAVKERDLSAPPAVPANGDRYLVAANPTGAWAGNAGLIAAFQDGAWVFLAPQSGWLVWVQAEGLLLVWNASAWVPAVAQPTLNPTPLVGINTTADTTNRLAVKAPATLLDNAGNGHQLKINKAHPTDTASVLLQDAYAGHAELGLTGDDNFHVKVSPDGATWTEAIVINNATGQVSFPHTTLAATQVNADWAASTGAAQILNKPSLGSSAALNAGAAAGNVVALDANAKLPAVDGSQLVNIPAGPAGPQGPAGLQGVSGPAGPQGPAGAAGGVYTVSPAYTNPGGQGDRRALITQTILPSSAYYGTATNLLDGLTAHQSTDIAFNAVTAVGLTLTWDFGVNAAKVVNEITWIQTGTQSHGVFQAQVSNDGVTWTAVGATFTLGGATSQVIPLTGGIPAFRYLQLLGVSGTMSGGPYISEIQFKIAATLNDGQNIPTPDGTPGKVLTVLGDGKSFLFAADPGDVFAGMPYSGMLAQWKFNELSGTQCLDSVGAYPIDLTLPSSQNYTRTGRGIQTSGGLIQTPSIPAARMVAMLYRVKRDTTAAFLLSGGNGSGNGLLPEGTSTGYTYTVGNGFGVVHPMVFAAAGQPGAGTGTHEINRGGWLLVFVDFNAAYTTALGFGGQYGTTAYRCTDFELAWAGVWNRSLTSTEQATVYAVMRKAALAKGFYLSMYDCPRLADAVVMLGESTMSGHGVITDLSAADQALAFKDTFIQPGLRAYTSTNYARPHPFELGLNQMIYDPTGATFTAAVNFGPEFGFAFQHRANQLTRTRPLYILKAGLGSTFLSSAYLATSIGSCWSNTDGTRQSLYYYLLRMLYDLEQGCRADGIGLNLASLLMMLGLNDASSTTYAPDSATYQGYIQSFFSQLQTDLGLPALPKMVLWEAHSPCTGANATALTNVRAGQAAFVTAQGANAALINTDAYPLFADGVHFTSAGLKTAGIDGYNQTGL